PAHAPRGLRRDAPRRPLPRRLPRRVRPGVVERVRRDAGPVALRVRAHMDEARAAREIDEAAAEARARALRFVDLREPRVADGGEEPGLQARGAAGGPAPGAAPPERRRPPRPRGGRAGHAKGAPAQAFRSTSTYSSRSAPRSRRSTPAIANSSCR